jgi:hypothetical protein
MSKMTEEVTRAIATKFLGGIEGFELIKLENYKNYVVYLAFPGRPIYVLIDELGKARYATDKETHELMRRANPDEEEDED